MEGEGTGGQGTDFKVPSVLPLNTVREALRVLYGEQTIIVVPKGLACLGVQSGGQGRGRGPVRRFWSPWE